MVVSVVIPVFNRVDLLAECLVDLVHTAPNAEVIVADDASTEDVPSVVRTYRDCLNVRYSRTAERVGFSRVCNFGATFASGRVLIFLNSDIRTPRAGWARPMVAALDSPSVGIVGALLWYPTCPPTTQHAGIAARGGSLLHIYRGMTAEHAPGMLRPKYLQAVTGACLAIRADDFRQLGGFDLGYQTGYEDVDLCFRVRFELQKDVLYEPHAQLVHLEAQSDGRFDHEASNAARFYERWRGRIVDDYWDILRDDRAACCDPALASKLASV